MLDVPLWGNIDGQIPLARRREREAGIEPERPSYELHTFQCPDCEHFETAIGKVA